MSPTSIKDQRETAAMRDVCARDIADRVVAGDTSSETFAAAVRVYQELTDELATNARQVAESTLRD